MKQNSFISVILTIACSLMFVACSDWTEPTPVDYNPIFPDEQDPSLHEKYEQSLKEYKNRKHTLMLIRFANNPGTTLGEQDFLRSLPDSVDFVVLTNADNLSVYDKEDISKLKEFIRILRPMRRDRKPGRIQNENECGIEKRGE